MQRHARRALVATVAAISLLPASQPAQAAANPPVTPYAGNPASLKQDLCYQITTDRFHDGNPANNNPGDVPGMFYDKDKLSDPQEWHKYMGGDFAGITQKLDYLKNMGVGAVYLSPHVDNINVPSVQDGKSYTGYHGYWPRDFRKVEERFGTSEEFDALVSAAHARNIKVIMDWSPNGTNPPGRAEDGALYDDGQLVGKFGEDGNGYFHHTPGITDWNDAYQNQNYSLEGISDLNQQHPRIDQLLKDNASYWMSRGVDGIRMDAVKHMPLGWQRSFADSVTSRKSAAIFGEWYMGDQGDPLYPEQVKFANTSGIAAMDFYTNRSIRDVFGTGASMKTLDAAIDRTNRDYTHEENLVTFLENHDTRRFGTVNPDPAALHRALAFLLTTRGTPCLYYGTEQYLHNDTGGGRTPYNRAKMNSFNEDSAAYREVQKLSALRQANPAVPYGNHQERWLNDDVYVYERKFGDNVVLTAINKGSRDYQLDGLRTALPAGTYTDVLEGGHGGFDLTVNDGGGADRTTAPATLGAGKIAVWSHRAPEATTPLIGGVGPVVTRAGNTITVEGIGFGTGGTVKVGGVTASVQDWKADRITVTVPAGVATGSVPVTVSTGSGTSNEYQVLSQSGKPIPVQFTVENLPAIGAGESVYLTGNVTELGKWSTSRDKAAGPLPRVPNTSRGVIVADLPAGARVEYKFVKVAANGAVIWEGGANHSYTVPTEGTGATTLSWQR